MTREPAQDADLDFEQMMGELAAMKTDLANRQANRVGSRSTTPRAPGAEAEPRRARTRRPVNGNQVDPKQSEADAVDSLTKDPSPETATLSGFRRQDTLASSLRDLIHDDQEQDNPAATEKRNPQMTIEATTDTLSVRGTEAEMAPTPADSTTTTLTNKETAQVSSPDLSTADGERDSSRDSRRNLTAGGAPLPPKSAQRSRSISHNSSRLSHAVQNESSGVGLGLSSNVPQDVLPPQSPRKYLRPYPSSPSLSMTDGQLAPASPRLPARSHSRKMASQGASHTATTLSNTESPSGAPPPVVPPRTRSGSKSLSRSNTFNRSEAIQEQSSYNHSPTIAEDQESQTNQQQDSAQARAQYGHMRKKSSSNGLGRLNEGEEGTGHPLEPSLLPSEAVPSHQFTPTQEQDYMGARPALRKQKSADPGQMYRQQHGEETSSHDHLPTRHASERRPQRDRNHSNPGPIGDEGQQGHERGRSQRQEESSSKGGMFSWVRSRSKSKDASGSRPNYDTSHPVPEQPAYPEYNPALIPNRNPSSVGNPLRRDKSLSRKTSAQNMNGGADAWPPYSATNMGKDSNPEGPGAQRKKSLSRPGPNGTVLNGPSRVPQALISTMDPTAPQLSLNVNTNSNTAYHDTMVRGMGMGSTPITPTVLLSPQPSFPLADSSSSNGALRGAALAMMKDDDKSSKGGMSEQQLQQQQQRQQQLQQAQMQHLQQQQQKLAAAVGNSISPPGTPISPRHQTSAPPGPLSSPAATPTVKLVATRIYIQTETDFKSLNLEPTSTALDALHMLQKRGCFGEPGDGRYHDRWTIFEYSKEFLIERPLRDFEVILDVMKTWEADKDNKMICKSFPARDELSAKEVVRLVGPAGQASFVRPHGWVHLEMKKNKWVKRYLHITDTAVYHSKDNKFNGESMLCLLRNFDVYAVQVPRKKSPTKFGFALKSSDKIHLFETPEDDYIHYVCTDSGESLREWLVGLRAAKGMFMYHANPEVIREGQKHALELTNSPDGQTRGNLTEEQIILQLDSKSVQGSSTPLIPSETTHRANSGLATDTNDATIAGPAPSFPPSFLQQHLHQQEQQPPHQQPISTTPKSIQSSEVTMGTLQVQNAAGAPSHPTTFMTGSLLQQRADAERQEVENMKQQLRQRAQAGVVGAPSGQHVGDSQSLSSYAGKGLVSSTSSTSSTSLASSQSQTPKFGGPGTLIEKGEDRIAQLLERSKSAGTGLLRPQPGLASSTSNNSISRSGNLGSSSQSPSYHRSRSKSRPPEDRALFGGPTSPHSPNTPSFPPAMPSIPQGPLLHFDDGDAMIQPGLLLNRAKSSKQPSSVGYGLQAQRSPSHYNGPSTGPHGRPGLQATVGGHQGQRQGRTRIKPLIDLGGINTGQDMIGPGLLTGTAPSGSQSARSPRRNKPLLDF